MTAHEHSDDNPFHGSDQYGHGGVGQYLIVFVCLCVLTAISFAVGNSQNLRDNAPGVMWAMMMAVSCAKALLVILFFMHLKWEANWKYVLTVPASIMSIFLLLMLTPDIGRRTNRYSDERWRFAPQPVVLHEEDADAAGTHAGHGDHPPAAPAPHAEKK
jgi:cytochrome c oxidase subunit 4